METVHHRVCLLRRYLTLQSLSRGPESRWPSGRRASWQLSLGDRAPRPSIFHNWPGRMSDLPIYYHVSASTETMVWGCLRGWRLSSKIFAIQGSTYGKGDHQLAMLLERNSPLRSTSKNTDMQKKCRGFTALIKLLNGCVERYLVHTPLEVSSSLMSFCLVVGTSEIPHAQ